jgi:hypothetical protein
MSPGLRSSKKTISLHYKKSGFSSGNPSIKSNLMSTDEYISLLEVDLACARQRILVLEAKCAMLGDTGDDILPQTPPKSPSLLWTPCPLAGPRVTKSKVGRAPQNSQRKHSCLRGKSHSMAISLKGCVSPRGITNAKGHLVLILPQTTSIFCFSSTPSPVKKMMPGSTRIPPHPAIKPYMAEL